MSAELLPCPFCGHEADEETIIDVNEGVAYTPSYEARCGDCGCTLPGVRDYRTAVAFWNRRATSSSSTPLSETPSGASLIAVERARQVNAEGWTRDHDDAHTNGELAQAAACYAWPNPRPVFVRQAWPWEARWWKPAIAGDRIGFPELHTAEEIRAARLKDLVRAGALIAAEIDRLQRASPSLAPLSEPPENSNVTERNRCDSDRLDELERILTPSNPATEVFLAGLRRGAALDATAYQCEIAPSGGVPPKSFRGQTLREAIDKAVLVAVPSPLAPLSEPITTSQPAPSSSQTRSSAAPLSEPTSEGDHIAAMQWTCPDCYHHVSDCQCAPVAPPPETETPR